MAAVSKVPATVPVTIARGDDVTFEVRVELDLTGYTLDEVRACIVHDDGGLITVDETHPAYPREPKAGPGVIAKGVNLAKAVIRHVNNRGRQCTDEEIAARFAICQTCPRLVDERCTHPKCGCGIKSKRGVGSKLSWASERCPEGKWGAIPPEPA